MADDARFEVEEGQEVVRRTIVGGRPRARMKRKVSIPIGIEKVLVRAAGDEAFRSALFEDREQALGSSGYTLLDSERGILRSVPDTALARPIRDLFPRLSRRGVLVIASDFLDADLEGLFSAIRLFRHRHFSVVLLHIVHPQEERLPSGAAYRFIGLEGEGIRQCSPRDVADLYERRFRVFLEGLRSLAVKAGCDYHRLSTAMPYVHSLESLLVERRHDWAARSRMG